MAEAGGGVRELQGRFVGTVGPDNTVGLPWDSCPQIATDEEEVLFDGEVCLLPRGLL